MKPLKNTVVNCRTQEESDECMKLFESWGWKWRNGENPTEFNAWDNENEETCYKVEDSFGYAWKTWYKEEGYKVISFQELKSMANEPKYKVGDVLVGGERVVTIKSVEQLFVYYTEEEEYHYLERELEDWKLKETNPPEIVIDGAVYILKK